MRDKLLLIHEQGKEKVIQLRKELDSIEYRRRTIKKELAGKIYETDLEPMEYDFNSKEDFGKYIFLYSKLTNLEFLVDEILESVLDGEDHELIKCNNGEFYNNHMNGFYSGIKVFADLF